MGSSLKSFLVTTLGCFFCCIAVQHALAKSKTTYPDSVEMQATFDELDKVLRIFDLGEIEPYLRGLDRSDPKTISEVYLILAYHDERLGNFLNQSKYSDMGIYLAGLDKQFHKRPFSGTYEAILNYLIYKQGNTKESIFDAAHHISNMEGHTSIQKYIKCEVFIGLLIDGEADANIDFVNSSLEHCPEENGLHYMPYAGAALHTQNQGASFDERIRYFEELDRLSDDLKDPYAQLTVAFTLFGGAGGIEANEISIEAALSFKNLIADYELNNSALHFIGLLGYSKITGIWGNQDSEQHFKDAAKTFLESHKDPRKFLVQLNNQSLAITLSHGFEEKLVTNILIERWQGFKETYNGNTSELSNWRLALPTLANVVFFRKSENLAIEILNSFIDLHDQGPKKANPFTISDEYSESSSHIFKKLNKDLTSKGDSNPEILPFIYETHALLADLETHRDNDEIAKKHYELAWSRMPAGLKLKSEKSVDLLIQLLYIYRENENLQKIRKTASRILDIIEETIFSSKGPFAVQKFEGPNGQSHEVNMAIYELWFIYLDLMDQHPEEAQIALSDAFRGVQIMRANRLTKLYKTENRETALKDIFDLKKYSNLSRDLVDENVLEVIEGKYGSVELNRDYKFSVLKDVQSDIPLDTIILAAYDSEFYTHFAYISSYWFDPFYISINKKELSNHMTSVLNSAKNSVQPEQFNYKSANWIYSKIFQSDNINLSEEGIKNIVFLPSKSMFNFPISLLHNGQLIKLENSSANYQYDPNGFLLDEFYVSYAVDFQDDMFGGLNEHDFKNSYKTVESSSFFGLADPYLGNDRVAALRGIKIVEIDQPDLENLPFESLPETLDEVNAAAKYFTNNNIKILSGEMATKKNMLSLSLIDYDVLMFSTHGVAPGVVSGFDGAGLLLSLPNPLKTNLSFDDVFLTPDDVLKLKLDADIVILNACNSGISDVANAPGLTGLAQSFLAAGSDAVMVTHWPIDSITTVQITKEMFDIIKKNPKKSFNKALTEAQLSVKSDPKKQYPFYWSPYNIYGNF
jgi:CHAT domain-containing protein